MTFTITYNPTGTAYGVVMTIRTSVPEYRLYVETIIDLETPSEGGQITVMDGEGEHGDPYDRWFFRDGRWDQVLDRRNHIEVKA